MAANIFSMQSKRERVIISEDIKSNKKISFLSNIKIQGKLSHMSYKLIKKPKNFVAVTGTNGKSSIADFYYQILNLNKKSSFTGTIGFQFNKKICSKKYNFGSYSVKKNKLSRR